MNPFVILFILCVFEIVISPEAGKRYRNIGAVVLSFFIMAWQTLFDIILSMSGPGMYMNADVFRALTVIQAIIIVIAKIRARHKDALVKYGIPQKYTSGWRASLISLFYDFDPGTPVVYTKGITRVLGIGSLCCSAFLFIAFLVQSYVYNMAGNTLLLPYSISGLVSFLIEFGMFCIGDSLLAKLLKQYKRLRGCRNRRELAKARYSAVDDYRYIFMKHFVWEPLSIIKATMFRWKKEDCSTSIQYYNFEDRTKIDYAAEKQQNPYLEQFIQSNNIEVNELYVTAYNLIGRNQNVLIKTPSYVDFEPYLTALIKMKVAQTEKVVLVVSNEEKKVITIEKLKNAFVEYFGFEEIPLIKTINECAKEEKIRKKNKADAQMHEQQLAHFKKVAAYNSGTDDTDTQPLAKLPDIIIAAPEDVCQPEYVDCVRNIVGNLGLIVYYDFSDCVQEEALFGKIVHSVLDYDDEISTLYMSDGFFDLEQVVDNFFSKRNLYEIVVPRKPADRSYVTAWKAETINEMQSRTDPDASRNIGNHIPILYDVTSHTENDLMIVEDEYDAYTENKTNFSQDKIAHRFDRHVGWSDVLGGNSVACSVSDTYNNVAHTYMAMRGIGSVTEYINIVSRPYLLRNYLMFHLRYFAKNPKVLSSYSPGIIKTARAIAYEAAVKSFVCGCTAKQIAEYVAKMSLTDLKTPEEMLEALAWCAFGEFAEDFNPVITKNVFDRYYLDETSYSRIIEKSGLIEKIEFIINNQVVVRNKKDYSCLIPHQKIVLGGTKYTVEKIEGNRVELSDTNKREAVHVCRPVRKCDINVLQEESYGTVIQNSNGSSLRFRRLICDVNLDVYGNLIFKDGYHPFRKDAQYDYYAMEEDRRQHKEYKEVNVFCVTIGSEELKSFDKEGFSHLLALLFNEMLPTFFPRHSERIIIGCNGWNISGDDNPAFAHTVAQMNINDDKGNGDGEISLYFLEDSPVETGLVSIFWQDEEFKYMLRILEDYLYYQEIIKKSERKEIFGDEYKEKLFILRRILLGVINETYEDVRGNIIRFNRIRRSRNKFNSLDIDKSFNITCDFCGKEIHSSTSDVAAYHYYAYSGLVSCADCFSTAVCTEKDSKDQVYMYQNTINTWFYNQYKDGVDSRFYNYLEDIERLSELCDSDMVIQNRVLVTDDEDVEGLQGLAYSNADSDYEDFDVLPGEEQIAIKTEPIPERAGYFVEENNIPFIMIRDGLKYGDYMSVLCHEMTHQWQFARLSIEKLCTNVPVGTVDEFGKTVKMSVYRMEGHAEWERIRYMKSHGMRFKAFKEAAQLRARRDEYGLGYVWMSDMMKVGHDDLRIPAVRTFKFIMKRNYYQFTKNSFALMRLYFGNVAVAEAEPEASEPETTETEEN